MFEGIHERSHLLRESLEGLQSRERLTANNLANADTPNYKAQAVNFETQLQQTRQRTASPEQSARFDTQNLYTHNDHIPLSGNSEMTIYQVPGVMRNDGNGVDLDTEMATMAQAQISYNAVSQVLTHRYAQLKYVIAEGGR